MKGISKEGNLKRYESKTPTLAVCSTKIKVFIGQTVSSVLLPPGPVLAAADTFVNERLWSHLAAKSMQDEVLHKKKGC